MAKQPIIKIDDIKDIADVMTKSEIVEVEQSFVKQAVKSKEQKPAKLVVEEIKVNDRNDDKDIDIEAEER